VGAFPRNYDPSRIIEKAKEVLEENFHRLLAQAKDEKEREKLSRKKKDEEGLLDFFCEEKLIPACKNANNHDAAVFICTNSHGDALSLNIRQWQKEKAGDKRKCITRLQPILGRRGVFCPQLYHGHAWGENNVPFLIVEGEVNWLHSLSLRLRRSEIHIFE
jgi:hypothetical protein